jgi:hypothetical protein
VNWSALGAYYRDVRTSSRVKTEPKPDSAALKVDAKRVGVYRANASHLTKRLLRKNLDAAAYGGLQDSAPRSALLSLHARVEKVGPLDWEDPALVQVWFRGADYVVPKKDVGIFTIGALPRDPEQASALNQLADSILEVLAGQPRPPKEVAKVMRDLPSPFVIRSTCVTGKVHIRWDASKIDLVPAKAPKVEPEEARLELARRFLHWMGPAGPGHFGKWAGISPADASETWRAIGRELVHVDFEGRGRWVLASDESRIRNAKSSEGVRFLPLGDPYLYLDQKLLIPANRKSLPKPDSKVTTRLLNSLAGRILLDGKLVGVWGRVQNKMTVFAWTSITKKVAERISVEAATFEGPIGTSIDLRWLS